MSGYLSAVPPRHLYVHVPFCARRCSYCDFAIAVRSRVPVDEYLTSLRSELDARALGGQRKEWRLDTLYFGGGTPSRLGGEGMARLMDLVREYATLEPDAEVTIEANPEDVSAESASAWRAAGVNRMSLGSQSFDDRVLSWMHRVHDGSGIHRAVGAARDAGIENLSLDLIFNVPDALERDWRRDVDQALGLAPDHLSLYGLTVEPATPLARWLERGETIAPPEEGYESDFLEAHGRLSSAGFDHYEVSNFARPGRRSRHNSSYWTGVPYTGAGPSAHGFDGVTRRWNAESYAEWVRVASRAEDPVAGSEMLTPENRLVESVYLGLRTDRGLHLSADEIEHVQSWLEAGWAHLSGSELRLTARGWLRLDSLASSLTALRSR